jgi:hypothetical protein
MRQKRSNTNPEKPVIQNLGDGLTMRYATKEDTERLAAFNASVHTFFSAKEIAAWTVDFMSGEHPGIKAHDFTLIEDTHSGEIVSSLNLISQTFLYAGVPFGAGRIELVGTHPEYRRRGLVRVQMDAIHRLSESYEHQVQIVEGIPWFYRQFGYEPTLETGSGRSGNLWDIPQTPADDRETFLIRPALEADIPFISKLYNNAAQRYLVTCLREREYWRYDLLGRSSGNPAANRICVIERHGKRPVGFFAHPEGLAGSAMMVFSFEITPGASWQDVTSAVLRYLLKTGQEYAGKGGKPFDSVCFMLGLKHPLYEVLSGRLPKEHKPSSWYVRIPDVAGFIRNLSTVLERHLAGSPFASHSGELQISFYRSGVALTFEDGNLQAVSDWQPQDVEDGNARFPGLTFLQLLLGYRSLQELQYAFVDCEADEETSGLLSTLFVTKPSSIWSLE